MEQNGFDRLVGGLYNTVVDPSSWSQVLLDLRGAFDASATSLNFGRTWGRGIRNRAWSTEPALSAAFNGWAIAHERMPISSVSLRVGEVATDQTVVERTTLSKTPYFNEVLVPYEASKALMIKIAAPPGPTINVLRGNRHADFSDADLALARRLSYHAVQALEGMKTLGARSWSDFVGAVDAVECGIVLLDDKGESIHLNPPAAVLTAAHDGVRMRGKQIGAIPDAAERRLRQAVFEATQGPSPRSGSTLTIDRPSGARRLVVRVTPVEERTVDLGLVPRLRAIVSILDPERVGVSPSTGVLREVYGITRREADVVHALAAGFSITDAAKRCGVTLATARNYLARALRKTDLNRQADLVLLIQRMNRLHEASRLAAPC